MTTAAMGAYGGLELLGAAATYSDRATVERVQRALAARTDDPAYGALARALSSQKNAYGVNGPATKKAVAAFNAKAALASDGASITATTLSALFPGAAAPPSPATRPAPSAPSAPSAASSSAPAASPEQMDSTAAAAKRAADAAVTASSAGEVAAVKQSAAGVAQQVVAQAPPELKDRAVAAQQALAAATSPDEVRAATAELEGVAEESKSAQSGIMGLLQRKYGPLRVWQYALGVLGVGGVGFAVLRK